MVKVFGEINIYADVAERLLELYEPDELLEVNNLEETEVVELLLRLGRLESPETIVDLCHDTR